ncbi:hypothetical protein F0562_013506 [Nyssa sinensis]|uniref:Uncharacterized protein n=1 Tax=Nyssa sinensis TaxID=561372 RepID=A0A5J4ZKR5_9ASTE|nr:hypothetical protein F0562_013506 [Nyssa sinensis]
MVSEPMGTNKERIEWLEAGLGGIQDGLQRMELGMVDKLHHLETSLNRLSDVLLSTQESSSHNFHLQEGNNEGRQIVSSKTAKLEFPRFVGDELIEWFRPRLLLLEGYDGNDNLISDGDPEEPPTEIANGEHLKYPGWFEKVPVDLQGILFSLTLYSLPLSSGDIVARTNRLCGLQLETVNHGIYVGKSDQDIDEDRRSRHPRSITPGAI